MMSPQTQVKWKGESLAEMKITIRAAEKKDRIC